MSEWTRPAQPVRCVVELDKPLAVRRERGVLAQGDANANAIVAEVYSTAGKPYDLSGCTMQLIFVRPDNNALPAINAEIIGNTATATLPDSAYAMSGMYSLRMKLRKNGAERTIVWIIGEVKGTDVDGIADPEHVISIGDIMASAKEAQTAASNANTAAQRANAGAERAEQLQIDASGLAGDSNKLGGKPPEYYLPVVNLFDNSDWRNGRFIAQAGFVAAHGNERYMGDRWKAGSLGTATLTADGIIVNTGSGPIIWQVVSGVAGKTLTFGIKTNATSEQHLSVYSADLNDSIYHIWEYPNDDGILCGTFTFPSDINNASFVIYPELGSKYSEPVLYPGVYTADTLPPFVPPDPVLELAKCQNEYQRLYNVAVVFGSVDQGSGEYYSSGFTYLVPMRTVPTLNVLKIESSANRYGIANGVEFITGIDHLRTEHSKNSARFISSKASYAGCSVQFYEIELSCEEE